MIYPFAFPYGPLREEDDSDDGDDDAGDNSLESRSGLSAGYFDDIVRDGAVTAVSRLVNLCQTKDKQLSNCLFSLSFSPLYRFLFSLSLLLYEEREGKRKERRSEKMRANVRAETHGGESIMIRQNSEFKLDDGGENDDGGDYDGN